MNPVMLICSSGHGASYLTRCLPATSKVKKGSFPHSHGRDSTVRTLEVMQLSEQISGPWQVGYTR